MLKTGSAEQPDISKVFLDPIVVISNYVSTENGNFDQPQVKLIRSKITNKAV